MKKFTLLLVLLLAVVGAKAVTSTQLALTGGYNYNFVGETTFAFSNNGHLNITPTLGNFDVSGYTKITLTYTGKSGNFKLATIGKKGVDANYSLQTVDVPAAAEGSVDLTFSTEDATYASNEVDGGNKKVIYRVDLIDNNSDGNSHSITITSVKIANTSNEKTTMEYRLGWSVEETTKSHVVNFAGWTQMGSTAWQADIAEGTLHKYTITFGAAVPSGMILQFKENGLELNTSIAEGATSVDIYRTAAYTEFTLRNNTGDNKTVNLSSVYRHVLTKNSSTKLNDDGDAGTNDDLVFGSSWTNNTTLQGSNAKTQAVKVGDILEVTVSTTGESSYALNLCEGGTYNTFATIPLTKGVSTVQTHCVPLTSAKVVEAINEQGIIVSGQNVTVSSIAVVNNEESADDVLQNAPITITSAGFATYSNPRKLDFTSSSVKAYYAKEIINEKDVVMSRIYKVPANTGLYLVGDAENYDIPYYSGDDTETITTNLLHGSGQYNTWVYESIPLSNEYRYILANNGGTSGFYKVTADGLTNIDNNEGPYQGKRYHSLGSHKAYLQTTADISPAARVAIIFDDEETTGVNEVRGLKAEVRGEYYDLMGRKVAQPTRGLYIVNGKKVVIK